MPQRGPIRASRQAIVSWTFAPPPVGPLPAVIVAAMELPPHAGAVIVSRGVVAPPAVYAGSQLFVTVRGDAEPPWPALLAGAWIGGKGFAEALPPVPVPPVLPGPRTTICGSDSNRSRIAGQGRSVIEGSSQERTKIYG